MLRGCWSWIRYGDTAFGSSSPLDSPMAAPPQRGDPCGKPPPMLSCSTGGHRQHSSVPRRRGRRRNGFPFSNASKLLWLPRERGNSPTSTHTCWVVYLHSVARGGGKPFASPSPGKSSHCTHALLFRTTMTAFPRNGHVLYKDLPTPYQLSGNNSWGSFLQSKTVWDRKIEARLCFTWSAGQKHSRTAQSQETRDASILMLLGPCTHAIAPNAQPHARVPHLRWWTNRTHMKTTLQWFARASPEQRKLFTVPFRWGMFGESR